MKITRSNYESWFLDFLERNLDPLMADEFQAFLFQNPDLADELATGDFLTLLSNNSIQFDFKEQLKISEAKQDQILHDRMVAYHEGDLEVRERANFESWLSRNPIKSTDAELFGRLKLIPDRNIIFKNKDQLKKTGSVIPLLFRMTLAAAIIFVAYLLFVPGSGTPGKKRTSVTESKNLAGHISDTTKTRPLEDKIKTFQTIKITGRRKKPVEVTHKKSNLQAEFEIQKKVEPIIHVPVRETVSLLLKPRSICFNQSADIRLALMTLNTPEEKTFEELELSELLKVHLTAMRKSDDREILSAEHLGLTGLQLIAWLSGKRLTARKGNDGVVRSVRYNSRFLAFSIPVNR